MSRERATLSAVNNALAIDASSSNAAMLIVMGGTVAAVGANLIFEASINSTDGTDGNWVTIPGVRTNANTQETSTGALALGIGVTNSYAHRLGLVGFQWFRARVTAITSGNVVVDVVGIADALEISPYIPTHGVSGSVTATPPAGTAVTLVTAATTNATAIVGTTGALTELAISNPTATPAFVKLYNKATAPTVGTDVPLVTIPVPANGFVSLEFGTAGKRFALGIGLAVTALQVATDATVTVAGIQISGTRI